MGNADYHTRKNFLSLPLWISNCTEWLEQIKLSLNAAQQQQYLAFSSACLTHSTLVDLIAQLNLFARQSANSTLAIYCSLKMNCQYTFYNRRGHIFHVVIRVVSPPPFAICALPSHKRLQTVWNYRVNLSLIPHKFSTKMKIVKQPITAHDLLEQRLSLADSLFSFWYWNWGVPVNKSPCM